MFCEDDRSEVRPDQLIFVAALSAVTGLNNFQFIGEEVVVGTAVLNVFTRVGSLSSATKFFETMRERNEYSLSTMIAAFSVWEIG